jgi:divalent metal cation (Fe/Co/Zn/Cd) transporter
MLTITGLDHVPTSPALIAAVLSILAKEVLFHRTMAIAKKERYFFSFSFPCSLLSSSSDVLVANAWHHRSDSISTFVALIGIGGAILGYSFFFFFLIEFLEFIFQLSIF